MAVAAQRIETVDFDQVEGLLNYLVDTGVKPVSYNYDPPPGVPQRTGTYAERRVSVLNGRRARERFSLDEQGFLFLRHETAVKDFYNEEEVKQLYYPEVESLMKQATGAIKVVTFDHTLRVGPSVQRQGLREPVRRAHNDYTEKSGPQRVRDLLDPEEAEERLKHRFAVVNLWRPIRGPVEEAPLAVCDARSIAPKDLIATDLLYRDRTGEVYSLAFNPDHRWVYFPRMQNDEVVFLKCYDSATDGRARFAAHSAFDDPTGPRQPRPRESIETRSLLFFAPED
jgi:hypothetical protein